MQGKRGVMNEWCYRTDGGEGRLEVGEGQTDGQRGVGWVRVVFGWGMGELGMIWVGRGERENGRDGGAVRVNNEAAVG